MEFLSKQFDNATYNFLLRLAAAKLRDINSADDVVQETYLIAHKKIKELMQSENPRGYLVNILKFVVMHEQRARSHMNNIHQKITLAYATRNNLDYHDEPELFTILKKSEYDLLRLVYIEGYTQKEVAEKLGVKYDTCRKQIQKAKRKLIQEIE